MEVCEALKNIESSNERTRITSLSNHRILSRNEVQGEEDEVIWEKHNGRG